VVSQINLYQKKVKLEDIVLAFFALTSNSSSSSSPSAANAASTVEHQATVDNGLKMKIKRKNIGSKSSEAKHEIVQSDINPNLSSKYVSSLESSESNLNSNLNTNTATLSNSNQPSATSSTSNSTLVSNNLDSCKSFKHSSSKSKSSNHRDKKDKNREKVTSSSGKLSSLTNSDLNGLLTNSNVAVSSSSFSVVTSCSSSLTTTSSLSNISSNSHTSSSNFATYSTTNSCSNNLNNSNLNEEVERQLMNQSIEHSSSTSSRSSNASNIIAKKLSGSSPNVHALADGPLGWNAMNINIGPSQAIITTKSTVVQLRRGSNSNSSSNSNHSVPKSSNSRQNSNFVPLSTKSKQAPLPPKRTSSFRDSTYLNDFSSGDNQKHPSIEDEDILEGARETMNGLKKVFESLSHDLPSDHQLKTNKTSKKTKSHQKSVDSTFNKPFFIDNRESCSVKKSDHALLSSGLSKKVHATNLEANNNLKRAIGRYGTLPKGAKLGSYLQSLQDSSEKSKSSKSSGLLKKDENELCQDFVDLENENDLTTSPAFVPINFPLKEKNRQQQQLEMLNRNLAKLGRPVKKKDGKEPKLILPGNTHSDSRNSFRVSGHLTRQKSDLTHSRLTDAFEPDPSDPLLGFKKRTNHSIISPRMSRTNSKLTSSKRKAPKPKYSLPSLNYNCWVSASSSSLSSNTSMMEKSRLHDNYSSNVSFENEERKFETEEDNTLLSIPSPNPAFASSVIRRTLTKQYRPRDRPPSPPKVPNNAFIVKSESLDEHLSRKQISSFESDEIMTSNDSLSTDKEEHNINAKANFRNKNQDQNITNLFQSHLIPLPPPEMFYPNEEEDENESEDNDQKDKEEAKSSTQAANLVSELLENFKIKSKKKESLDLIDHEEKSSAKQHSMFSTRHIPATKAGPSCPAPAPRVSQTNLLW